MTSSQLQRSQTIQYLSEMRPSAQKEILELINQKEVAIDVFQDSNRDLTVKIQYLEDYRDGFEEKQLRKQYFRIRQQEIPKNSSLKTRHSDTVDDWKARKIQHEILKVEQFQLSQLKKKCPTRRTVIWLNKIVEDIVEQRMLYLRNEVAVFTQKKQQELFKSVKYLS